MCKTKLSELCILLSTRKLFVALAMMFILSVSCAAQIKIGIEAGANYSIAEENGWKVGYQAGVTASKEFANHLTLSSALYYQHVNLKLFMDGALALPTGSEHVRKLDELVLPIRIGYRFYPSDVFQWEPSAGVYGNYIFHENRWSEFTKRATDQFSFGWIAGVKGIIASSYTVSLDYRMSFGNMGIIPDREHSILLSVGYLF